MAGEVTLRGKLLPVGGIKERVRAARRAGTKTVILPRRNEHDLDDIPPELRNEMKTIFVDTIDQVLEHALRDREDGAQDADAESQRTKHRSQPSVEAASPRARRTLS